MQGAYIRPFYVCTGVKYHGSSTCRFNTLYISGDHVNVRWSETGEFKFSGSYGIS